MPSTDIAKRPIFRYLMLLTFASAMAQQGWASMYTNYAVEIVGVTGQQTGIIHALREVPGLLSVGAILCLLLVSEHTLIALSVFCLGLGAMATGFFPTFWGLVGTAMFMSFGFHYYESTVQSLSMQHFDLRETPLVLGRLRSATGAGSFFVGAMILALSTLVPLRWLFCAAGGGAFFIGLWALTRKYGGGDTKIPLQRKKMVLRRRYRLFYLLMLLSGARRHIFSTFSIFLLVSRFHFSVQEMLFLFLLNNAVNWILNPLIGKAINNFGERKLLTTKYIVLGLIFWTYCTTDSRLLVGMLYVIEQLFTNFTMAIRTFFQKISDPQDIAPSMAVGQTINHISAVILPIVGGTLWMVDFRIPFWIGMGVAAAALIAAQFVRIEIGPDR